MEIVKPGQFVEATYDLFVGAENELMERQLKSFLFVLFSVLIRCYLLSRQN